uniref:DUF3506 domain-containing protein n=1 Tax=Macrostomum lignano TaxID=282301 RepID=A0A1I8FH08_9PLAT
MTQGRGDGKEWVTAVSPVNYSSDAISWRDRAGRALAGRSLQEVAGSDRRFARLTASSSRGSACNANLRRFVTYTLFTRQGRWCAKRRALEVDSARPLDVTGLRDNRLFAEITIRNSERVALNLYRPYRPHSPAFHPGTGTATDSRAPAAAGGAFFRVSNSPAAAWPTWPSTKPTGYFGSDAAAGGVKHRRRQVADSPRRNHQLDKTDTIGNGCVQVSPDASVVGWLVDLRFEDANGTLAGPQRRLEVYVARRSRQVIEVWPVAQAQDRGEKVSVRWIDQAGAGAGALRTIGEHGRDGGQPRLSRCSAIGNVQS